LFLGAPPARPGEDPKKIVRQALRNDTRNRELERSYTYTLREEMRKLDSGNAVKRTESKTGEVIPWRETLEQRQKRLDARERNKQRNQE
jgi:hypothetical protein